MAIPLARQQGAGPQLGSGQVEISHEAVNPFRRPRPDPVEETPTVVIQFAEPISLQPISQNTEQQVAGQVRRWSPPKNRVAFGSAVPCIETTDTPALVVMRRA